jgi:hypothetical protein
MSKNLNEILNGFYEKPTSLYDLFTNINRTILKYRCFNRFLMKNKKQLDTEFIDLIKNLDDNFITKSELKDLEFLTKKFTKEYNKSGKIDITIINLLSLLCIPIYNRLKKIQKGGLFNINRSTHPDCRNNYNDDNDCWEDPINLACIDNNYLIVDGDNYCYDARGLSDWIRSRGEYGHNYIWPPTTKPISIEDRHRILRVSLEGHVPSTLIRLRNFSRLQLNTLQSILPRYEDIIIIIIILGIVSLIGLGTYRVARNPRLIITFMCYIVVALWIGLVGAIMLAVADEDRMDEFDRNFPNISDVCQ